MLKQILSATILAATVGVSAGMLAPTTVSAQCNYRLANCSVQNDIGYSRLYLYNNTGRTLFATVRYKTLAGEWVTNNWYVEPGERAFIVETRNRNITIKAKWEDNTRVWHRRQINIGQYFTDFTYTFNY